MDDEHNIQGNPEDIHEIVTSESTVENSVQEEKIIDDLPKDEKAKMPMPKRIGITSIILLLVIVSSFGGYSYWKVTNYEKVLEETHISLVSGTISDIYICGIYSIVWSDAIRSRYSDFNTELANKKSELQNKGTFTESENTKNSIDEGMKKLNNPPKKYQRTYDKIFEMYGIYSKIHSQALSPSGSLVTFNANINNLQEDFTRAGNELKVIMPSKDSK